MRCGRFAQARIHQLSDACPGLVAIPVQACRGRKVARGCHPLSRTGAATVWPYVLPVGEPRWAEVGFQGPGPPELSDSLSPALVEEADPGWFGPPAGDEDDPGPGDGWFD